MSETPQPDGIDKMILRLEQLSQDGGPPVNTEGTPAPVDYTATDLDSKIVADSHLPLPKGTVSIGKDHPEVGTGPIPDQEGSEQPPEPQPFDYLARAKEEEAKNKNTDLNLMFLERGDRFRTRWVETRADGSTLIHETVFEVTKPAQRSLHTPGSSEMASVECISGAEHFIDGLQDGDTIMIDGTAFGSQGAVSNTLRRHNSLRFLYTYPDGQIRNFTSNPIDTFTVETDPGESNKYEPVALADIKERYRKKLKPNEQVQTVQSRIEELVEQLAPEGSIYIFNKNRQQAATRFTGSYSLAKGEISLDGFNEETKRKINLREGRPLVEGEKVYYLRVDEDYKDGIQRDHSKYTADYIISNGPSHGSLVISIDSSHFPDIGLDRSILSVKCIVDKRGAISFDFFSSILTDRLNPSEYKRQIRLVKEHIAASVGENSVNISFGNESFSVPTEGTTYVNQLFDLLHSEMEKGNIDTPEREEL